MKIDAELYRKAYELYRQWNEAERVERRRNAGRLTPQQAWEQYADLWEFGWQMGLQPSQRQRERKLKDLGDYYTKLQNFEEWRKRSGRTP